MRIKPFVIGLGAAAIAFANAPASGHEPQSNSVAREKSPQKKKCRWVDRIGTHRLERICLTAEEWRKVNEYLANEF